MRSLFILFASVACASGNSADEQDAVVEGVALEAVGGEEAPDPSDRPEVASASASEEEQEQGESISSLLGVSEGDRLSATLETSMGDITCQLFFEASPMTVLNFVQLAEGDREWKDPRTGMRQQTPLYNGTIFHRVIPGFMIQGGDPVGNGTGGPGYRFPDEVGNGLSFNRGGLLAMANSGPNTNGSQFFITEGTPTHLTGRHTIFGECGPMDLVRSIGAVQTGSRNKPLEDVVLQSVTIEREAL